jgi:hypothetical protein
VTEHDPIEVVRRGYEAFRQAGIEGVVPLLDPEIEWRNPQDSPIADVFRGHAGVREWYAAATSAFEDLHFEPDELVPFAHIWAIRDGLATYLQMYSDPADALSDATAPPGPEQSGDV